MDAPNRTGLIDDLARAALLACAGGAFVGAVEALGVLFGEDLRYTRWAARIPPVSAATYAGLGAALALPSAILARVLYGRPSHRSAPAWVPAGLGAILALAVFTQVRSLPNPALLPAAFGGTLLFLALRELLGWWGWFGRASHWFALTALALAAAVVKGHLLAHTKGTSAVALMLAAAAAAAALQVLLKRRAGAGPLAWFGPILAATALALQWNAGYPPAHGAGGAGGAGARPNILHVSIDTLRPERLGCYGNADANTPTIDRLAAEGVLFENVAAQSNTTGPSHTTQLTGLYPAEHGALSNMQPLSVEVPTVLDLLGGAGEGLDSAGFISGFTLVDSACGLAPRFGYYDDNHLGWQWLPQAAERIAALNRIVFRLAARGGPAITRSDRPARWTADAAIAWLNERTEDVPFYLFLHFYDPHVPYEPPAEFVREGFDGKIADYNWYRLGSPARERLVSDGAERARMLALYDGEIAYADAQVARVLAALEAREQLERTVVVLTSDHGEGLGGHDYYYDHGTFLYDEELRVPLILRLPGGEHAGTRVAGQTRLLDLTPTLLELSGVTSESRLSGTSLVPHFDGSAASDRPSFARAEMSGDVSNFSLDGRRLALRSDRFKLIWTSGHWLDTERIPERYELYDLAADPDERVNLIDTQPAEASDLVDQLQRWNEATEALVETGEVSEDLLEHMRALGYL